MPSRINLFGMTPRDRQPGGGNIFRRNLFDSLCYFGLRNGIKKRIIASESARPSDRNAIIIKRCFFHVIYHGSQIISIQLEVGHQEIRGGTIRVLVRTSSYLSADLTNHWQTKRGANQRVVHGNPWHSSSKIASFPAARSRPRIPCVVKM